MDVIREWVKPRRKNFPFTNVARVRRGSSVRSVVGATTIVACIGLLSGRFVVAPFGAESVLAAPGCQSSSASTGATEVITVTSTSLCDLVIPSDAMSIDLIVVGAGGGGGAGGAGGGGGEIRALIGATPQAGTTISVSVGAGGIGGDYGVRAPSPGGDSVVQSGGVDMVRAVGGRGGAGTGSADFGGAGGTGGLGGLGASGGHGSRNATPSASASSSSNTP